MSQNINKCSKKEFSFVQEKEYLGKDVSFYINTFHFVLEVALSSN